MGRTGPVPKLQHQRERDTKRRTAGESVLVPDRRVRGPLPAPEWADDALDYYNVWRKSAQAQLFEPTDWLGIRRAARLLHENPGKMPATVATELRLLEDRYGATFTDRARAKIRIERGEQALAADAVVTPLRVVRDDLRDRLRADPEPTPATDPDIEEDLPEWATTT